MGQLVKALQERPQGVLPSNTVPNPREDVKVITTRSGITLAGHSVPPPHSSSSSSKEVERDQEPTIDQFLKDLLTNKEKLLEMVNTPLNENCSADIFKKLPEKLGDPRKFLIHCDFSEFKACMSLADLGASINLMPLNVWEKLMLPELVPTRMTLELANRSVAYPTDITEDVFVQVGKFTFPADFVVVDYDVYPRVPLILGRPFLRTVIALVDVHGEKLILRVGEEKLTFKVDITSKYSLKYGKKSINMIDIFDTTCEDHFYEVLKLQILIHPLSGNPNPSSDLVVASLSPSLTLRGYGSTTSPSDHSLLDYEAFCFDIDHHEEKSSGSTIFHSNPSLLEYESFYFDLFINPLPIFEKSNSHHEEFADELAHIISLPEYDHFYFDIKADLGELTRILRENISSKSVNLTKIKKDNELKPKTSTKELTIHELNILRILLSNCDSTFFEEFLEIDPLVSFPSENKEKIFDPGILIINGVHSKRYPILPLNDFSPILFISNLLFLTNHSEIETLLSFPSGNEDKVFDPGIFIINGIHSFMRKFSCLPNANFKIDKRDIFSEISLKIKSLICFHPKDNEIRGELVPSCCVIFDLEPLSLSFDFIFDFEIFKSFPGRFNFRRTSLTGFPAQSARSSNAYVLDSPYLLVLNIGTSQSRQHNMSESDSYYISE
ncbi:reverse transcriptase domain-containing protein [Tanacetum coccineum]|uniref:Reverse transcriptase domain-containing protein n=1 Tax=Tanacetum coccineum TaxID=301880 RepID=A0ABQ5AHE0_9ASTR